MTLTQTIEIPANRRQITIDIPQTLPSGKTIISFTPVSEKKPMEILTRDELLMKLPPEKRITVEEEAKLFKKYADELNAEAMDVLSYQSWNKDDGEN